MWWLEGCSLHRYYGCPPHVWWRSGRQLVSQINREFRLASMGRWNGMAQTNIITDLKETMNVCFCPRQVWRAKHRGSSNRGEYAQGAIKVPCAVCPGDSFVIWDHSGAQRCYPANAPFLMFSFSARQCCLPLRLHSPAHRVYGGSRGQLGIIVAHGRPSVS